MSVPNTTSVSSCDVQEGEYIYLCFIYFIPSLLKGSEVQDDEVSCVRQLSQAVAKRVWSSAPES